MYKVIMDGRIMHDPLQPLDGARILLDGVVSKQVNHADSFQFTIYPNNFEYSKLHLITSRITVLKDDAVIFHGRPLTEETGWENEKRITCEGDLALLNDSVLRPYSFSGSVAEYVRYLINIHNSQVGADKQITVRHITVTDPNDTIRRSNSDYVSVMQEIMDKTVGSNLGGYLHTEYDATNDVIYLDYLVDSTNGTNQTLEIGKNILDFQRSISSEALATALIPLGATDQDTGERLTIKSVNEGQDYIVDSTAAAENGLIYATYTWDDVTQPANLLSKARAVLTDLTRIVPRIQLSAVDLTNAGVQVDAIDFFEYVTVVDSAHNVSGQYLITERVYNISAPENDTVTFGGEEQTISGQSARTRSEVAGLGDAIINKAIDIIDYQTDLLKGGAGGYMVIGTDEDGHPNELFFMDTDSVDTARSILRLNKNGIGFSTTGIGGPYTNAWTIDGNLHASFMTTGILRDRQNKNYWNLDTGEMHVEAFTIISEKLDNIGGRNLLLRSRTKHINPYNSPTMTYEDNVAVPEWGCADGMRAYGTIGSGVTFGTLGGTSASPQASINGQKYVHSIYIKNNSSVPLQITNNSLGGTETVAAGESKRVVLNGMGNGRNVLQFVFYCDSAFDFVWWHPQIEYGEVVTSWTPAPEDDENAIAANSAQIAINATNITSKVSKTDYNGNTIASLINQTATTIQISANKVDLRGYVTFSNLSTSGQTAINGSNITTGTLNANLIKAGIIADTAGKNRWNLTTGSFVINDGKMDISGTLTFKASDYVQSDIDAIQSIIIHENIPTLSQWARYDVNLDGCIDIFDLVNVRNFVIGISGDISSTIRTLIDPSDAEAPIKISSSSSPLMLTRISSSRIVTGGFISTDENGNIKTTMNHEGLMVFGTSSSGAIVNSTSLRIYEVVSGNEINRAKMSNGGIEFRSASDAQTAKYGADGRVEGSIVFDNGFAVGSKSYYYNTNDTRTYTLTAGHTYFLVYTRTNVTASTRTGLWIVNVRDDNSSVAPVLVPTVTPPTVSVSGTTLTVVNAGTYDIVKIIDLGDYQS